MELTHENIEREISLKRIKPEALIAEFEKFFQTVAVDYQVTFGEGWRQRKKTKAYFKPYDELLEQIDISDLTKQVDKMVAHSYATVAAVEAGQPMPQSPDYDSLTENLQRRADFIEHFDINPEEFKQINDEYQSLQLKHLLSGNALNGLISSGVLGIITTVVSLALTVILSLFVEAPAAKLLKPVGETLSEVLPIVALYFTLDRICDRIKEYLLWQRVKTCYSRYKEIKQVVSA